jgi:hypothetical protein
MSKETASSKLGNWPAWCSKTVPIIRAVGAFQPHFATGVQPKSHLTPTDSIGSMPIFLVNVAFCRILSHRRRPEPSNFAKFASHGKQMKDRESTCRIQVETGDHMLTNAHLSPAAPVLKTSYTNPA